MYPIARGSAPVLVLARRDRAPGEAASAAQVGGVLLVAAGVLLVRGIGGPAALGDLALALAIGVCIAAYTLLDQRGVEYASPIVYQELSMIPGGARVPRLRRRRRAAARPRWSAPSASRQRRGTRDLRRLHPRSRALSRAPAASVAAVRETSVVIATALAVPLLHERVGPARLAGAVVVVVGVVLLSSSQADRTTGAVRDRQLRVGSRGGGDAFGDRLEPRAHPPRVRVDVQEHVLARRERLAAARIGEHVEQVQPLLVGSEDLRVDGERLERVRLAQVADVTLDRVRAVAAVEVRGVEPDMAQERVGRVPEDSP